MTASNNHPLSMPRSKFPKALAAAGLAAVLVGCGSSNSTSTNTGSNPETPPTTASTSTQEDQRTAIMNAVTAVQPAVEAVTDTATDEVVKAADEAVAALQTALTNAKGLSEDDPDVASAREKLTTLTKSLADAKASRMTAIEEMEAAAAMARQEEQRTAIMNAVTAVQTAVAAVTDTATDEVVMAAEEAIDALETAIRDSSDQPGVDIEVERDLALANLPTLKQSLADAKASRMAARGEMEAAAMARQEAQRMAIMDAVTAVQTAVEVVTDTATDEVVMAADEAVAALQTALANAADLSAEDTDVADAQETLDMLTESLGTSKDSRMAYMEAAAMTRQGAQRTAIMDAVTAVQTAVEAVTDTATDEVVMAADEAVAALQTALANAADLSAEDTDVADAQETLDMLTESLGTSKDSRMAYMEAAAMTRQEEQTMAIMDAVTALRTAVEAVTDPATATDEMVMTADEAVAALETALANAEDLAEDDVARDQETLDMLTESLDDAKTSLMAHREDMAREEQRTAITTAEAEARTAVAAVTTGASDEVVADADAAVAALEAAIKNGTDIDVDVALSELTALKVSLGIAKDSRTTTGEEREMAEQDRQRMAITTAEAEARTAIAAVTDDASDEVVMAAKDAVAALEAAIESADEDLATDDIDLEAIKGSLDTAKDDRMEAQRTAITDAVMAVRTAVGAVTDTATDEVVMAAEEAVAALEVALENGTALAENNVDVASAQGTLDTIKGSLATAKDSRMAYMEAAVTTRQEAQRMAITGAVTAAQTAVDAVMDTATDAVVKEAEDAVAALQTALANAEDLAEDDDDVESAQDTLTTLTDSLATAKDSLMAYREVEGMKDMAERAAGTAETTAQTRVKALNKYSTGADQQAAESALIALREAYEALPGNEEGADEDDITTYEGYKDNYDTLNADLRQNEEERTELMQRNDLASRWISAMDQWNDNHTISLQLNRTDIHNPENDHVIGEYSSIEISAFQSDGMTKFVNLPIGMGTPDGWKAGRFEIDSGQSLKIFTNRSDNFSSLDVTDKWEEFWGTDNNRGTGTDLRRTAVNSATDMEMSKYFEERYHKYAFGKSYVDILRGASNASVTGEEAQEVIRIAEGGTSAIHYTDLDLGDFDLRENKMLKIGTADDSDPIANVVGQSDLDLGDVELFGQEVTLSCTVLDSGGTAVSSGGGCQVSLSKEGFIEVTRAAITATGAPSTTETGLEDGIAYLNLTTDDTRAALNEATISLMRPDSEYTVMGYWMDEEGSIYNVDTFATARYGPAGETGITDNTRQLTGSATYNGDAVGVYVLNAPMEGYEMEMDLYNGEFEAAVELTASFNTENDSGFTVEGTIDNFMSLTDTEDHDLADWTLILSESTTNNSNGSFTGTTAAESPMGDDAGIGDWQGQFYGKDNLDTSGTTDDHPLAVVGDFSGDFGNSNRAVGVFSAEKTEE